MHSDEVIDKKVLTFFRQHLIFYSVILILTVMVLIVPILSETVNFNSSSPLYLPIALIVSLPSLPSVIEQYAGETSIR